MYCRKKKQRWQVVAFNLLGCQLYRLERKRRLAQRYFWGKQAIQFIFAGHLQ